MREVGTAGVVDPGATGRLERASEWFIRLRSEAAGEEDLAEFQRWTEQHPENSAAYRHVTANWDSVGPHAATPEIMLGRRDALEDARRASMRRWAPRRFGAYPFAKAAAVAGLAVIAGFGGWKVYQSRTPVYETGLGERRTLTLEDRSIVTLDARSRIRVAFTKGDRSIELEAGQARFEVAKDAARPFSVRAGGQTVRALGTQFNVELVSDTVLVTLIEGLVAVTPDRPGAAPAVQMASAPKADSIEIHPGQQLVAAATKPATVRGNVDLASATAWQSGKLLLDNEPLASAAERVNRYSRQRIVVHPSVAHIGVSGIFNAGDAHAFVEAVTTYFPVVVERLDDSTLQLEGR
jgi:transmembrane sensor